MRETSYQTPFAVATVFRDEHGNLSSRLDLTVTFNSEYAAAATVNLFHKDGGKGDLLFIQVAQISEEMARNAVAIYDQIAALRKAEEAKVVQPKFGVVPDLDPQDMVKPPGDVSA